MSAVTELAEVQSNAERGSAERLRTELAEVSQSLPHGEALDSTPFFP